MPKTLMTVDLSKAAADQEIVPHNRWHPEVPPIAAVDPGEIFRLECLDWTGGQVGDNDSANDIRDLDLLQVH
jgi:formamidase